MRSTVTENFIALLNLSTSCSFLSTPLCFEKNELYSQLYHGLLLLEAIATTVLTDQGTLFSFKDERDMSFRAQRSLKYFLKHPPLA